MDRKSRIRGIAANLTLSTEEKTRQIQSLYRTSFSCYPSIAPTICEHYTRQCDVVAMCCNQVFGCRLCHDESSDHKIDRHATEEMVCRVCKKRQPVNEFCGEACCGWKSTFYFCKVCKFWSDDAVKKIFHCAECGICRVGKREEFQHCSGCNLCLPPAMFSEHTCCNSNDNCSICGELMQNSRVPISILRCGHALHNKCLEEAQLNGLFYCPLCRKSFVKPEQFDHEGFDRMLQINIMPEEYQHFTATISCNDCNKTSETPFHFVGHRCLHCNSLNTICLTKTRNQQV